MRSVPLNTLPEPTIEFIDDERDESSRPMAASWKNPVLTGRHAPKYSRASHGRYRSPREPSRSSRAAPLSPWRKPGVLQLLDARPERSGTDAPDETERDDRNRGKDYYYSKNDSGPQEEEPPAGEPPLPGRPSSVRDYRDRYSVTAHSRLPRHPGITIRADIIRRQGTPAGAGGATPVRGGRVHSHSLSMSSAISSLPIPAPSAAIRNSLSLWPCMSPARIAPLATRSEPPPTYPYTPRTLPT